MVDGFKATVLMPFSRQKHIYDYLIDEHGEWFCEGNRITDDDLFRMLSRSLFEQNGRYFVRCQGEVHPVRVSDAPLWIRYVHVRFDSSNRLQNVEIELRDGRREALSPGTLTVANQDAIYCFATSKRLRARFGKVAYYEIAKFLETDTHGDFFLRIGDQKYELRPETCIQQGDAG